MEGDRVKEKRSGRETEGEEEGIKRRTEGETEGGVACLCIVSLLVFWSLGNIVTATREGAMRLTQRLSPPLRQTQPSIGRRAVDAR